MAKERMEMLYQNRDQQIDGDGNFYSADVPYLVFGYDDETAVLTYAYSQVPKKMENVDLDSITVSERIDQNIWKVIAHYPHVEKNATSGETEIPEFSFDISSKTVHITQSLQNLGNYAPSGETAPTFGGGINADDKGEFQGVDIMRSTFSFTEKHYYEDSKMTNNFKRQIAELTNKVNSGTFRGWSDGEVMFLGASGSRRGKTSKDKWEVVFRFQVQTNRTNVHIDDITIPSVKGWEYVWTRYRKNIANGQLGGKVASAHLERVYDSASFSILE